MPGDARAIAGLALLISGVAHAQVAHAQAETRPQAMADSTRCDSIVAAARVDSTAAGLFISVGRVDPGEMTTARVSTMQTVIGAAFIAPRPFRLTVFGGSPSPRFLRLSRDTTVLRSPVVSGTYRVSIVRSGKIQRLAVLRASLMPGFDMAAASAIRAGALVDDVMSVPEGDDSMAVDVSFSSDSVPGARRLAMAYFPRMPVIDAVPLATSAPLKLPEDAKQEGIDEGDIVLRFVVDRQGEPMSSTVELVRGRSLALLRAAVTALPTQHFRPATIKGCAVAQVVEYAFNFFSPEPPPEH